MSDVSQIYQIVNEVAEQTLGESAIAVVDTGSFVSLGDKVLSSATDTDSFLKTLVDRIGKTVYSIRRYMSDSRSMVRHSFEFGCIVQKIYVDLPSAKENNTWNIGEADYEPKFAPIFKPSAKQKLFNKISTWEIDVTIPDTLFKTAFLNEINMATFIDAIFTAQENMMELALENNEDLTRANFIAKKLHSAKPCGAINLLTSYNTLTNKTLTVDSCLRDVDFLKWASMTINLWSLRIRRMSTLFNDEGYKRFTPREELVINVLDNFATATASYLESDTYHKELVSLPRYERVPYWQGSGTSYDFDDVSKIHVKLDDTTTVEQTGVIAVMYDYQAMGVTLTDMRSASERNNHDEYANYYNKANIGYFNDMSENGIVFYIAET